MGVVYLRLAALAVHEVFDHARAEGPRSVEGHGGHDVFEAVWAEVFEELLHARRLELEHPRGLTRLEQFEGLARELRLGRVGVFGVHGNVFKHEGEAPLPDARDLVGPPANHADGEIEHGERGEPEEVELDQARGLDLVLRVLGDNLAAGALEHGHRVPEGPLGDHDARGVHARVSVEVLDLHGEVDEGARALVLIVHGLEARLLGEAFLQGYGFALHGVGHQLGDGVDVLKGHSHDAPDVAHATLRLQDLKRGDLAHGVAAVLLAHVRDHLLALEHAEVDVEVGHRHALGVQEPFEEQVVGDGVDVGNAQGVRHDGAGAGAAPRAHGHLVGLTPVDEVLYDEKVPGKLHLLNHADLELEPVAVLLLVDPLLLPFEELEALVEALAAQARKVAVDVGHDAAGLVAKVGQRGLAELQLELAHLGDAHGVRERLGKVREGLGHLVGALEKHLVGVVRAGLGLFEGRARRDAAERALRLRVVAAEVVRVVGGHHRQLHGAREVDQDAVYDGLLDEPVILQLDEELARVDDLAQQPEELSGLVGRLLQEGLRHEAAEAPGKHHHTLGVRREALERRLRRAALGRVEPRVRNEGDEVAIALLGGRQEREVIAPIAPVLVGPVARKRVPEAQLAAQNGLQSSVFGLLVEVDGAVHVAVVGEGHGGHAHLLHARAELLHANGALEHRVLRVNVQVNEVRHRAVGPYHAAAAPSPFGVSRRRHAASSACRSGNSRPELLMLVRVGW